MNQMVTTESWCVWSRDYKISDQAPRIKESHILIWLKKVFYFYYTLKVVINSWNRERTLYF